MAKDKGRQRPGTKGQDEEDAAQPEQTTAELLDDLLRRRTGKEPSDLSLDEQQRAIRNEILEQSGVTDRLQQGRRVIGAPTVDEKDDEDIKDNLDEEAHRQFVGEVLNRDPTTLGPKDFADFNAHLDRLSVEAVTGKGFDELSPLDRARARQLIRNDADDERRARDDGKGEPGGIPGFGDHRGDRPGTGPAPDPADQTGPGTGPGGRPGDDPGTDPGGDPGDRPGPGPGPDPGGDPGVGPDPAGDPGPGTDPSGDPGGDPGTDPGGDPGTEPGADPGPGTEPGSDPGPGTEPGSDPGPGGDPGPDSDPDPGGGGTPPPDEPGDLRPVEVTRNDGSVEQGFIDSDGDVIDQDGNVIPADDIAEVSTTEPSNDPEDDEPPPEGDEPPPEDDEPPPEDDEPDDDGGADDAESSVETTPDPDSEGQRPRVGLTQDDITAAIKGQQGTETQPTEEGGFEKPPAGTPIPEGPSLVNPGQPGGPDGAFGAGGRPVGQPTFGGGGDIDPTDDADIGPQTSGPELDPFARTGGGPLLGLEDGPGGRGSPGGTAEEEDDDDAAFGQGTQIAGPAISPAQAAASQLQTSQEIASPLDDDDAPIFRPPAGRFGRTAADDDDGDDEDDD